MSPDRVVEFALAIRWAIEERAYDAAYMRATGLQRLAELERRSGACEGQ